MAMAAAAFSLLRRSSSQLLRTRPLPILPSSSSSMESPFAAAAPPPCLPEDDLPADFGSMDLMAVPKKKVSKYKKRLRNGPKALKPVPVIVRCNWMYVVVEPVVGLSCHTFTAAAEIEELGAQILPPLNKALLGCLIRELNAD